MKIKLLLFAILMSFTNFLVIHGQSVTPVDQSKAASDVVKLTPEQLQALDNRLLALSSEDVKQFLQLTTELANALAKSRADIPQKLGELRNFVGIKVETPTVHPLGTYLGKMNLFIASTGDAYKNESNINNKYFHGRFLDEVSEIANKIAHPIVKDKPPQLPGLPSGKEVAESLKQLKQLTEKSFMNFSIQQLKEIIGPRLKQLSKNDRKTFRDLLSNLHNELAFGYILDPLNQAQFGDKLPAHLGQLRDFVKNKLETGSNPNKELGNYLDKIALLNTLTRDAYKNDKSPYRPIYERISDEVFEIWNMADDYIEREPRKPEEPREEPEHGIH